MSLSQHQGLNLDENPTAALKIQKTNNVVNIADKTPPVPRPFCIPVEWQ